MQKNVPHLKVQSTDAPDSNLILQFVGKPHIAQSTSPIEMTVFQNENTVDVDNKF